MAVTTARIALLAATSLWLAEALPPVLDFRPARFARERYVRSRMMISARRLGLEMGFDNFASFDFMAFVNAHGYPAEEHQVTTADGYRLRLHRIPGSPAHPKAPGKPIVYLQHGLLSSSDGWIVMGPSNDLAYMLADAGYDVWLGNTRGNTYSRSHVNLSPDYDPQFWKFSFHEMAFYDLPTFIDYILHKTGQQSLIYVGHSMGTTISYALLSTRPEYNAKISLVISLAPVALWHSQPRPFVRFLMDSNEAIKAFLVNAKMYEVLPLTAAGTELTKLTCRDRSVFQDFCLSLIHFTSGYNPRQLNTTILMHLFSIYPAGASQQTLLHYSQNMMNNNFKMYDYGTRENLIKYKQRYPPAYNLSSIVTPVALFYGQGDAIVAPGNAIELARRLPNVMTVESPPDDQFTHLDFMLSRDVRKLLNERIMEITSNLLKHENAV